MKQGQVETVKIFFENDNACQLSSFFTYNLAAQYNAPSYHHKKSENKVNWTNLAAKVFLHSLSKLSDFQKKLRKSFSLLSTSKYLYIYMKSPPMVCQ